jgi:hypothetical protein
MLFAAPGRFTRYGPSGCHCFSGAWEVVEIRAQNNARQFKPFCRSCRRVGGAVPHSALTEAEKSQVRLLRNHVGEIACARCGQADRGVEVHHWAPSEFFQLESFNWPTSYLCIECHQRWHVVINGARPGASPVASCDVRQR